MTETGIGPGTLSARFAEGLDRYGICDDADSVFASTRGDREPQDLVEAGMAAIEETSAARTEADLEHVLSQGRLGLDVASDTALLLALFLYGRKSADGGAQIVVKGHSFGDHLNGLENVTVEAGAQHGDFSIDFLVTWTQLGPNPAYTPGDDTAPAGLEVVHHAAVVRQPTGPNSYTDLKLVRAALSDAGYMVVPFDDDDVVRDPFGIAKRVIDDLAQLADDELYPLP